MKTKKSSHHHTAAYFIPAPSHWPIVGALSLFLILVGIVNLIHNNWHGHYTLTIGALLFIYMLYGWFNQIIEEGMSGIDTPQMIRTYRWGMIWFIVSEIAFFGIFFGALFYARLFIIPSLGSGETQALLWPQFQSAWPLFHNPNPQLYPGPSKIINTWGIPALNTVILVSSAISVTWALRKLENNQRDLMNFWLVITIVLGFIFVCMQVYEYHEAYTHFNLTLSSGIYGTTFFMLTGFHAAHVTVGLIMLTIILIRCLKGHFQPKHHFAFMAVSWYWHFVDIVWLFLFLFVYWL